MTVFLRFLWMKLPCSSGTDTSPTPYLLCLPRLSCRGQDHQVWLAPESQLFSAFWPIIDFCDGPRVLHREDLLVRAERSRYLWVQGQVFGMHLGVTLLWERSRSRSSSRIQALDSHLCLAKFKVQGTYKQANLCQLVLCCKLNRGH